MAEVTYLVVAKNMPEQLYFRDKNKSFKILPLLPLLYES